MLLVSFVRFIVQVCADMASGLEHLHSKGIIHRDGTVCGLCSLVRFFQFSEIISYFSTVKSANFLVQGNTYTFSLFVSDRSFFCLQATSLNLLFFHFVLHFPTLPCVKV